MQVSSLDLADKEQSAVGFLLQHRLMKSNCCFYLGHVSRLLLAETRGNHGHLSLIEL